MKPAIPTFIGNNMQKADYSIVVMALVALFVFFLIYKYGSNTVQPQTN